MARLSLGCALDPYCESDISSSGIMFGHCYSACYTRTGFKFMRADVKSVNELKNDKSTQLE